MKALLYPEIYPNFGTGNVLRMSYLYQYLIESQKINHVIIISNDVDLSRNIIQSLDKDRKIILDDIKEQENFDAVIYDSPKVDVNILKNLRKRTKILIALDFFNYQNEDVDIIINLFSHNRTEINEFKGILYEGVQYCILKSEVLTQRNESVTISQNKPRILITFGGEDPNSNTLQVLKNINFREVDVSVIIGYLNKDRGKIIDLYSQRIRLIKPTLEIGQLMASSDIVVCGGGTTLLEAIYLGNPIIAIPQNKLERDFIDSIRKTTPLFKLEDLPMLISKAKDLGFRLSIEERFKNCIDGKGKERIEQIMLDGRRK